MDQGERIVPLGKLRVLLSEAAGSGLDRSQTTWEVEELPSSSLALPPTSCVNLSKSLPLSEPQFPHLYSDDLLGLIQLWTSETKRFHLASGPASQLDRSRLCGLGMRGLHIPWDWTWDRTSSLLFLLIPAGYSLCWWEGRLQGGFFAHPQRSPSIIGSKWDDRSQQLI